MENLQQDQPTYERIIKFFSGHYHGSYILVNNELLTISDINDVDIAVQNIYQQGTRSFLIDAGYTETTKPYNQPGYEPIKGSFVFTKPGFIPVHIVEPTPNMPGGGFKQFSPIELLSAKMSRNTIKDFVQIQKAIPVLLTRLEDIAKKEEELRAKKK